MAGLDTIFVPMMRHEGFGGTDTRDASLADFGHALSHDCAHCRYIRSIGPAGFTSIMGRILANNIQRAEGTLTTEEQKEAALPPKARKKAAKARHKARQRAKATEPHTVAKGQRNLLTAIRAAA